MNVSEVLAEAWAAVEKAKLPTEIQRDAFREAVRLIASADDPDDDDRPRGSARQDGGAQRASTKRAPAKAKAADQATRPSSLPSLTEQEFLGKLSAESGLATEKLERIYHLQDGQPQISLSPSKLGANMKTRMTTIAQLVTVARAYAFDEDGTPMTVIREECRRLRSLNRNINTYAGGLDGFVYVGSSRDKKLKVRPAGEAAFPALVDRLLGEAETA